MATYKYHRPKGRIGARMAGPGYGPPAPYPFQRSDAPRTNDARSFGKYQDPRFLEQRNGQTDYQRFRQGQSLPGYDPRAVNPGLLKGLAHLGMRRAMAVHPALRVLDIGFQVAYELDAFGDWTKWGSEADDIARQMRGAGFELCCDNFARPLNKYRVMPDFGKNYTAANLPTWASEAQNPCMGNGSCGTSLQTVSGNTAELSIPEFAVNPSDVPLAARNRWQSVMLGPGSGTGSLARMTFGQKWGRSASLRKSTGEGWNQPALTLRPQVALPSFPLAPPPPAAQETYTPLPNRQRNRRLRRKDRPAVAVSITPGKVPPGHVPPVETTHPLEPPFWPTRERKTYASGRRALAVLGKLYDAATEADEIVDILYKNLPKDKRCKGARGMADKAYCVWKNLSHLDVDAAIGDLIWNHYEDKAYGKFYSYGSKSPYGYGLTHPSKPGSVDLSFRGTR